MKIIYNIVMSLLLLNFLIFIHELGHFLAAKISKTKVNEFSIGMGPKLWSKKYKETEYSLRLLLIGGYVSFDDESFKETHFLKQAFIIVNGVVFNFICAIVFSWIYLLCFKELNLSFGEIFIGGFRLIINVIIQIFNILVGLFVTVDTSAFAGPAGIIQVISTYVDAGFLRVIELMVLFNVNLGIFNILPIPALDGGQLVYTLIKGMLGKKECPRIEKGMAIVGYTFIGLMLVCALINDFKNFFIK